MTSGGESGPSGSSVQEWRRPAVLTAGLFAAFGLVYVVVNATSSIDDRRALGRPIELWYPWVWEATSFISWLVLLPLVLWLVTRSLSAAALARTVAILMLASVPVSLAHTGLMIGLRALIYSIVGETYETSDPLVDVLVYEFRKDLITYASIIVAFLVIQRLAAPTLATVGSTSEVPLIEVRDGNQAVWLRPDEIDWVAAAGNYVELSGTFGKKLTRRTLAEMETELGPHGFVRVHRSRVVRKGAIAKIETRSSGDFEITLRSGSTLSGSRRYRSGI